MAAAIILSIADCNIFFIVSTFPASRLTSTNKTKAAAFTIYILTFHIPVSTLLVVVLKTVIITALIIPTITEAY